MIVTTADYLTSRDYRQLWWLAHTAAIVCIVDMNHGEPGTCRDIARTTYSPDSSPELVEVGSRGIGHVWAESLDAFIAQCENCNLEWLVPLGGARQLADARRGPKDPPCSSQQPRSPRDSRHPATPPAPDPEDVGELIHCLRIRERSLSQQNYNLVQFGDALYFGRAATRLEQQEDKLAAMIQLLAKQLTEPAKALVEPVNHQRLSELGSEPPWNRPGWCDAEGRCWFCSAYSMGHWNYDIPPDPAQDWGRLGTMTHSAPYWAIPRPRPVPRADAGDVQG